MITTIKQTIQPSVKYYLIVRDIFCKRTKVNPLNRNDLYTQKSKLDHKI